MRCPALSLAAILAALAVPAAAGAATIDVTTTADALSADGKCGLREAVIAANTDTAGGGCQAGAGDDTINLPAGTYKLTRSGAETPSIPDASIGDLDVAVKTALTFRGAGAGSTTIDANAIDRALDALGDLTVERLTVTGGRPRATSDPNSPNGGGIRAFGDLTLTDDVVVDNRAAAGSDGSDAFGTTASPAFGVLGEVGGNGGGVYAEKALTITGTRFERNAAGAGGAGGDGHGGSGSAISGSTDGDASKVNAGAGVGGLGGDGGLGGAVFAKDGATISASTFTANAAGVGGRSGTGTGGVGGNHFGDINDPNDHPLAGTGGGGGAFVAGDGGAGGAVFVAAGTGAITSSAFTGNAGGAGGAGGDGVGGRGGDLFQLGNVGGGALGGAGGAGGEGGAIASAAGTGTLSISASTMSSNRAGAGGAGGHATGGQGTGSDGDFHPNHQAGTATGGAGGLGGTGGGAAVRGGARLVNVTLHADAAGNGGAGGAATPGGGVANTTKGGAGGDGNAGGAANNLTAATDLSLQNATVSSDAAGDGGAAGAPGGAAGTVRAGGSALALAAGGGSLDASIVADSAGSACSAAFTDGGGNIRSSAGDASCPGTAGDPALGPLQDNGGPVPTRGLGAGSAALDHVPSGCPATDARGAARPAGPACDAGAYERTAPTATTGGATDVDLTRATVSASVNPRGPAATVHFEYGTTTRYGKRSEDQTVAGGFTARNISAKLSGLPSRKKIHYRVVATTADGSATGADKTFTAVDRTAPKISKLSVTHKRFRVSSKSTAKSAKSAPKGTTFRLKLSERATVTFSIRKVKSKKSTAAISSGTLKRKLKSGSRRVSFSGRIGRKALSPGNYKVTIRATDTAHNRSKKSTVTFTIVRR